MYDKYTARPAVFLSCNFIERAPRDTEYPWGLWSPFYSAINVIIGVFKRYLWCGT